MAAMDGKQWALVVLGMAITLVVMEFEKSVRNYLERLKYDVDDLEYGPFDAPLLPDITPLPKEARRFGHNESNK